MVNIRSPKETDHRRRHFVATAALTVAAQRGMTNAVVAQPKKAKSLPVKTGIAHILRSAEADRSRSAERRLCRSWPR